MSVEQRWLVFGASGFVGRRLLSLLQSRRIVCFGADLRGGGGGDLLLGDIRDARYVQRCFDDARPNVVVHLASFGMSGSEMANRGMTWDVNENGTRNVAVSSRNANCRLIYISTVNVAFNGVEVFDGREDCDYVAPESQSDAYSASKIVAEKIALSSGNCVALRPYGIYGEGEERHFPRIIRLFSWGLFAQMGDPADRSDWVHVDNLVEAILCAAAPRPELAGQAFFIGDGEVFLKNDGVCLLFDRTNSLATRSICVLLCGRW